MFRPCSARLVFIELDEDGSSRLLKKSGNTKKTGISNRTAILVGLLGPGHGNLLKRKRSVLWSLHERSRKEVFRPDASVGHGLLSGRIETEERKRNKSIDSKPPKGSMSIGTEAVDAIMVPSVAKYLVGTSHNIDLHGMVAVCDIDH